MGGEEGRGGERKSFRDVVGDLFRCRRRLCGSHLGAGGEVDERKREREKER